MKHKVGYEEGLHNAMLKAKIEYVATTPGASGYAGNFIEELKHYEGDIPSMKKFLKELGFKIIREFEIDEEHWFEVNRNINISIDGYVIKTNKIN